jgi:hypothetical protein
MINYFFVTCGEGEAGCFQVISKKMQEFICSRTAEVDVAAEIMAP